MIARTWRGWVRTEQAAAYVEYITRTGLSGYGQTPGNLGAQVRATVHSFGAVLLGKVMNLNETQTSVLSLIFKYCDDNQLPLLDLADLRTTLQYLTSDDGKATLADYGGMSTQTVGVLLRAIVNLEEAGADIFFGEPEFDVSDLIRATPDGKGVVSVLELSDVMDTVRSQMTTSGFSAVSDRSRRSVSPHRSARAIGPRTAKVSARGSRRGLRAHLRCSGNRSNAATSPAPFLSP